MENRAFCGLYMKETHSNPAKWDGMPWGIGLDFRARGSMYIRCHSLSFTPPPLRGPPPSKRGAFKRPPCPLLERSRRQAAGEWKFADGAEISGLAAVRQRGECAKLNDVVYHIPKNKTRPVDKSTGGGVK